MLAGCGVDAPITSITGTVHITGAVHGGQQPIVGAQIFLYDAGTSGNGSAAQNLLTVPVPTVAGGGFSITGDYTCTSATDQVYLVAEGGDPGAGANNSSIDLVAALGSCATLYANASTTFININEVTTAAAAWALGAFGTGPANVGASSTNTQGISNAMKNALLLADTSTGFPANVAGQTIEVSKLLALADALAGCVNSDGSACGTLFSAATPPGGSAPGDTFTAALNIVHYPSNKVADVFNSIPGTPAFPTAMVNPPNDWTMSDTIVLPSGGNGTASPTQIGIDGNGAVWVPDGNNGVLYALTPQGALVNPTGYGAAYLTAPVGATVDGAGQVWVSSSAGGSANSGNGYLNKFQSTTGTTPGAVSMGGDSGTAYYFDANTLIPLLLSSDAPTTPGDTSTGDIAFSNNGGTTESVWSDAGAAVQTLSFGDKAYGVAFDTNHGLWVPDLGRTDIYHSVGGTNTDVMACCQIMFYSPGLDSAGDAWVNTFNATGGVTSGYISAISEGNAVLLDSAGTDDIDSYGLVGDAGGVMWFADQAKDAFGGISSGTASSGQGKAAIGTSLAPSTGFGLDAGMQRPFYITPDGSGNLWVSDFNAGNMVLFFGMAMPTLTPQLAVPTAP